MGIEHIKKDSLPVFAGCCCSYTLLYFDIPACVGVTASRECLCLGQECCLDITHPPITCKRKSGYWCQIGCYVCGCYAKTPTTLCKQSEHCLCLIGECSFPPEPSMPCIYGSCFWMCAPKCGCCVPFKEVKKPENKMFMCC